MKYSLLFFIAIASLQNSFAQSAFLLRNSDYYYLLDRYDILSHHISDSLHTSTAPITQKDAVQYLENYELNHAKGMSAKQKFEIENFIAKNGEWSSHGDASVNSTYPIFNSLWKKQNDMFHIVGKNYTVIMNPIINFQQAYESNNTKQNLFINTKGIEVRGTIAKHLGFYTRFTDNQERGPLSFQKYVSSHQAVPGATYYKSFKEAKPGNAVDYLGASGYIDADVIKNTVNVSFGSDKFFIGDGYRSLFLSDFGSNYLFLKINTRLGRFNYQNLYMELTPEYKRGGDQLLPKKYAAMHYLSVNAAKWLNLGLFEGIVFSRKDHFEFNYLNPIILYRSVEQSLGSPDNAVMGLNFKINTKVNAVVYGQILLDEFKFSEIKKHDGWWGNKYAVQLGVKMADMFGIKNLLVQPELDIIRPFTYTFRDSVANYTHYNQALAHPYGANLMELSLNVRYKVGRKTYLSLRTFYNKQGRDTLSKVAFGGNIYNTYDNRNAQRGIGLFNGYPSSVLYGNLNASYEIRDNIFIDLGATYRKEDATNKKNPTYSSNMVYFGFRMNTVRRQYDY